MSKGTEIRSDSGRQNSPIGKPHVLAVEGKDEEVFLDRIICDLKLQDRIDIRTLNGRSRLTAKIKHLSKLPDFWDKVVSLGVVIDAEEGASAAYQSVCGALKFATLSQSGEKPIPVEDGPRLHVLILPGDDRPGSLETLCLDSAQESTAMHCVRSFTDCVEQEWKKQFANEDKPDQKPTTARLDKMRAHAFLSTIYEKPEIRMGEAAGKGAGWNFDHSAFDDIKRFLINLCAAQ